MTVDGLGLDLPQMMQRPSELGMLINVVEQNLGRAPRSVLEIGVWQGGTLARFRARWPEAVVIGIDPQPGGGEPGWTAPWGCEIVTGFSQAPGVQARVAELHPEPFDLVHVDGDHSLEAATADFTYARDVLKARMVALHDVAEWQNPLLEVWKLWHSIKLSGESCLEIRHDPAGLYGYGVVFTRG